MFQHIDISIVKALLGVSGLAGTFLIWVITPTKEKVELIGRAPAAFFLLSMGTLFFWLATIVFLLALIFCPSISWVNDLGFSFVLLGTLLATLALKDPLRAIIHLIRLKLYEWGIRKEEGW